ncbi:hypothetical protein FRB91_004204 [Serendipita sp. 411]|nr:hypothetical protein FRB91_004204 [Serendipita sp. 411]
MYPRLRIALLTVLISCEVTSTILTALHITQLASHLTYSGEAHTCLYLKPASNLIPIMLGMSDLVIETFIFGATIFHSFHFRQSLSIIKGARSIGILARLSAQGVQYYLFVFVFRLATILTVCHVSFFRSTRAIISPSAALPCAFGDQTHIPYSQLLHHDHVRRALRALSSAGNRENSDFPR